MKLIENQRVEWNVKGRGKGEVWGFLFISLLLAASFSLMKPMPAYAANDFLTVQNIEGTVELYQPAENLWIPLQVGMRVEPGSRVRTWENGRLILKSDYASLQLEPQSDVEVHKLTQEEMTEAKFLLIPTHVSRWEQEYTLKEGEVFIQVKPDQKKSRFIIETETAVMAVRGTFFKVKRFPDKKVDVLLRDGKLWVKNKIMPSELLMTRGNSLHVAPDVFLQPRHIQPLSNIERRELERPKRKLERLISAATEGAPRRLALLGEGEEPLEQRPVAAEMGPVAGPYQRDRLLAWRQDFFFKQNGREIGDLKKLERERLLEKEGLEPGKPSQWREVKTVTMLNPELKTSSGVNPVRPFTPPTLDQGDLGRLRGKNVSTGSNGAGFVVGRPQPQVGLQPQLTTVHEPTAVTTARKTATTTTTTPTNRTVQPPPGTQPPANQPPTTIKSGNQR